MKPVVSAALTRPMLAPQELAAMPPPRDTAWDGMGTSDTASSSDKPLAEILFTVGCLSSAVNS
jgi:hypothetical protein